MSSSRQEQTAAVQTAVLELEASGAFARAGGQLKLLKFLADHSDPDDPLKEAYIGSVLYGREATYDPRYDSTVRVNANRLRRKLEQHYGGEGAHLPHRLSLLPGSYALQIEVVSQDEELEVQDADLAPPARAFAEEAVVLPGYRGGLRVWALWAAVVVLLLAGGARWWWLYTPAFVSANLVTSPMTPARGIEASPSVSRDGSMLAYVSQLPGSTQFRIFLRPFAEITNYGVPLDTGDGDALSPTWSPDGLTIAFTRCLRNSCEVDLIAASGGPVRTIHAFPGENFDHDQLFYDVRCRRAAWTADGRHVIFPATTAGTRRVSLVEQDLASGKDQVLTTGNPSENDVSATLSPDGRSIAFIRAAVEGFRVVVLDLETHRQHFLNDAWPYVTIGLTWSPTGKGLLTSRKGEGDQWGIWWVPLRGPVRKLALNIPVPMFPVYTPGGTLLVLDTHRSQHLVLQQLASPGLTTVIDAPHRDLDAEFSPDGSHIAFLSDRSGQREIWLAALQVSGQGSSATQMRQLTHNLPSITEFQWSPDGGTIAAGAKTSNGEILLVNSHDGSYRSFFPAGFAQSQLVSVAFDGDAQTVFAAADGKRRGVFRIPLHGTLPVQTVSTRFAARVRFDGTSALYFDDFQAPGIFRFSVLESHANITSVSGFMDIRPRQWTVQKENLYYIESLEGTQPVHRYDLLRNKSEVLSQAITNMAGEASLSVSLSSQQMMYSQREPSTSFIRAVRTEDIPK